MPRVTYFEINSDNPELSVKFYKKVFDWKIEKWKGPVDYWTVTTGNSEPGINGSIKMREHSDQKTINTINVLSVEDTLKKVIEFGGTVVSKKRSIPGVGYVAYFKDVEGNTFGLLEENKDAH